MKQYLKTKSNQTGRPGRTIKRSKQDKRWTLLFIGNHGRTLTLKRFKGIVILSVLVLAVAVAVSAGLFVWNQKIIMDTRELQDELKSLNERLDALRHDKDILLTRLVVAESRVQESLSRPAEKSETDPPAGQQPPAAVDVAGSNPVATNKMDAPPPKNIEPPPSNAPSDAALSVAVEDFEILNHTNDNRIKVLFKIKNTSPNSQRVSGHVIVVLKGEQTDWLPIPWMPLVDGRPTGQHRGHSFGINYFKTMRLSAPAPKHPENYQTAAVYVFTRKGGLLLEQGYPVQLTPNKPQVARPVPGVQAMPTENETPPAAPPPAAETPPPAAETPPPAAETPPPAAETPPPAPETPPSPSSLQDAFKEALEGTSLP